jgi:diguanylate cyclase (GGDEF)-like protein
VAPPPSDTQRDPASTPAGGRLPRLAPDAVGSVEAIARAVAAADPALGRLTARRYQLAARLPLGPDRLGVVLAAALVADAARLATGHTPRPDRETVAAAVLGAGLLAGLPGVLGVAETVRALRERWDGAGGPDGRHAEAIPLEARALTVADLVAADLERAVGDRWGRAGRLRSSRGGALDPVLADQLAARLRTAPEPPEPPSLDHCIADLRARCGLGPDGGSIARLDALTDTVRSVGDPVALAARFAVDAVDALGATTVSVGRFDPGPDDDPAPGELVVLVHAGDLEPGDEHRPADERYPRAALPDFVGPGAPGPLLRTLTESALDDPHVAYLRRRGANAEASAPVVVDGRTWGAVWATSRPPRPELTHGALALLERIAADLAVVLATAERVGHLEDLAYRDPLTGLANRRVLEQTLAAVFARPVGDRLDVAVVMCDVDGLKIVNDTAGHAAGDAVLLAAAAALRRATAELQEELLAERLAGGAPAVPTVTLCRIGGDEFCFVVDGGGALHARSLADRAAALFQRSGPDRSISCGVALLRPTMAAPGELLRTADVAQYEEKRRRQQLGLAPERPLTPPGGRGGRRARRDR